MLPRAPDGPVAAGSGVVQLFRSRVIAVIVAVVVLLPACSGDDSTSGRAGGSQTPAVSSEPSPSAAIVPGQPIFKGPAVEEFGPEMVLAGHMLASDFVMRATFKAELINKTELRREDFAFLEADMTAETAASWRALAVKIEKGTATATEIEDVFILATIKLLTLTKKAQPVSPPFRNAGFLGATPSLGPPVEGSEIPTLVLEFPVEGELLLKDAAGVQQVTRLTKDMTITLAVTEDPNKPWEVHAWKGTRFLTPLEPDTTP